MARPSDECISDFCTALGDVRQVEPLVSELESVAPSAMYEEHVSGVSIAQQLCQLTHTPRVHAGALGPLACCERAPDQSLVERHRRNPLHSAGLR